MAGESDGRVRASRVRTWVRAALRRVRILTVTAATIALAGFLFITGEAQIARLAAQSAPTETADPVPVSAQTLAREDGYVVHRRFLGQVEPPQNADLSFELSGRLVEIAVDEGDAVAAGAVLARLDTALLRTDQARLEATLEAQAAQVVFAEASLERRSALRERGFSPDEAFDRAQSDRDALQAQMAETEAALEAVAVRLEKSELLAPFDGRIGGRAVDAGATVAPGQTVVSVFQTGTRRVRVGLPLWVDPGTLSEVVVEIDNAEVPARLLAVRPDIDPVTRTRTAIFEIAGDGAARAAFGETAALTLANRIPADGYWVPVAALREGLQGTWTVLVVDGDDVVRAAAVEIVHTEAERTFVAGALAPDARLIVAGPHRVTPGQTVRVLADAAGES